MGTVLPTKFYNFIIKDAALVALVFHKSSMIHTQKDACGYFPKRKDNLLFFFFANNMESLHHLVTAKLQKASSDRMKILGAKA